MMKKSRLILGLLSCCAVNAFALPQGFVYLKDVAPSILQDIRYYSQDNFIGRRIAGYEAPTCILTAKAAHALAQVQAKLTPHGLTLKVFDCYRPQTAVNEFIAWSHDKADQKMKSRYYPHVDKRDFFKLNYVSAKSGHMRGSTVDLTIAEATGENIPMGTHFDFLDPLSHTFNPRVGFEANDNRMLLRSLMQQAGFTPMSTEWWHFTLQDEPYPDTYFNFSVR